MRACLDCLPCLLRQALEATRFASNNQTSQAHVMREVLVAMANEIELDQSPPEIAWHIHRRVREIVRDQDPYAVLKRCSNRIALSALPRLRTLLNAADDHLATAAHLAIAANTFDAGMNAAALPAADRDAAARRAASNALVSTLERGLEEPLHGDVQELREALADARRILFLTDNCGEIVIDRLLIEQLPRERLTTAARGAPVLNDATLDDARVAGLDTLARVIDKGSDAPGTLLADCSQSFRRTFREADAIIAKGQGNYESLRDVEANVFFLFKVKCPVIARHAGLPLHSHALLSGHVTRSRESVATRSSQAG